MTAFAMVSSERTVLRFDTTGRSVPAGHTVTKPEPCDCVTVRLTAMATAELGGTVVVDPMRRVSELDAAVGGTISWRVSSTRVAVIGTNNPAPLTGAVASVYQPA